MEDMSKAGLLDGLVLRHGTDPSESWDALAASSPAVIRKDGVYHMYYYGRPTLTLGQGVQANPRLGVPFGWIGVAESEDGLHWTKVKGPLKDAPGAIFGPNEDPSAFDCVATGVGDVLKHPTNGELWMYYFGADLKPIASPFGSGDIVGLHMQIGLAVSRDGGRSWERNLEPILTPGEEGEWDSLFVAWPKVLPPQFEDDTWHMYYHTATLKGKFSMGLAISEDGRRWRKHPGNPLMGPTTEGAWDCNGVSTRHVVILDGQYVMIHEGVSLNMGVPGSAPVHAIGISTSPDGIAWTRQSVDRPVLAGSQDPAGWDAASVGTPHFVEDKETGRHRLYYVGFSKITKDGNLGMAECVNGDILKWRKVKSLFEKNDVHASLSTVGEDVTKTRVDV